MRRDAQQPHKCHALLRNFDIADRGRFQFDEPIRIQFTDFTITEIRQNRAELENAQRVFPQATYGDCIYRRNYTEIPPPLLAYGYGRIPFDVEDALLLLRLFRAGDVTIVEMKIEKPDGSLTAQHPYRAMADITSSFTYELEQPDVITWEAFTVEIRGASAWESAWFKIARRFFLYGSAKEFNVEWDEIDRIVDYMIALEAALVPERFFVGRCLRERASRLIAPNDEATKRFFRDLYDVRSTIAHGSRLTEKQREFLTVNRRNLEDVIRQVLVAALRSIPGIEADRRSFLSTLYAPSAQDYIREVTRYFREISDRSDKDGLLLTLVREQRYSWMAFARFVLRVLISK